MAVLSARMAGAAHGAGRRRSRLARGGGLVLVASAALSGCGGASFVSGGGGIVSTNPCADALLVDLVPPGRIAAISRYSQDPGASSMSVALARRLHSTAGTAEEVIGLKPDLVLTSSFTPAATRAAYARAGLKTVLLDSPKTVAASKAQVREVARAVGAEARGRVLVGRIDGALRAGAPPPGDPRRPSALLFLSGDLASGSGTLLDELLRRAGFRDAAADYGLHGTGEVPIEVMAARPPAVIMSPAGESRTETMRRRVLAATGAAPVEARFDRRLVNCGGPTIIAAMARLVAIRRMVVR